MMASSTTMSSDSATTQQQQQLTAQQVQDIVDGLAAFPRCGTGCPCVHLEGHMATCSSWPAAQPGYSHVHTELLALLPQLAVQLNSGNHKAATRHSVLHFYNM